MVGGTTGMMMLSDGGLPAANQPTFMQDDTGMAGLDPATLDKLRKGGGACTTDMVYPYKGTVFPRGLPSPDFISSCSG